MDLLGRHHRRGDSLFFASCVLVDSTQSTLLHPTQHPRPDFDIGALQREGRKVFGFTNSCQRSAFSHQLQKPLS